MELSQDFNAKVHSRDGMAHDFFGSVRVGKELCQRFFFCRDLLSVTGVPPLMSLKSICKKVQRLPR